MDKVRYGGSNNTVQGGCNKEDLEKLLTRFFEMIKDNLRAG